MGQVIDDNMRCSMGKIQLSFLPNNVIHIIAFNFISIIILSCRVCGFHPFLIPPKKPMRVLDSFTECSCINK